MRYRLSLDRCRVGQTHFVKIFDNARGNPQSGEIGQGMVLVMAAQWAPENGSACPKGQRLQQRGVAKRWPLDPWRDMGTELTRPLHPGCGYGCSRGSGRARPRPGDRSDGDLVVCDTNQHLGRRAGEGERAEPEEVAVRRRIEGTEESVGQERVGCGRDVEATGEHDLEGVAGREMSRPNAMVVVGERCPSSSVARKRMFAAPSTNGRPAIVSSKARLKVNAPPRSEPSASTNGEPLTLIWKLTTRLASSTIPCKPGSLVI